MRGYKHDLRDDLAVNGERRMRNISKDGG